jgi:hypothetical protein
VICVVKYDLTGMETVLAIQVFWVEENNPEARTLKHGYCWTDATVEISSTSF